MNTDPFKFSINDATEDMKMLADYLLDLGQRIDNNQGNVIEIEKVMDNPEFARLAKNIAGFMERANATLATYHRYKAEHYDAKVAKAERN
jgi:hypothetical protein